ncbi:MAG: gamma-glutamyltransferase [Chloroflexi bacterium]|uniref:Glutathione hydrolase proenzyme n=1 Tax=Candidatus Chlorohelix allophototropha TaxID=3003348 RepID=A0A8T7M950_9CHLR|nr:gamma-glutamyltransferase [Chloroflexota bacterium]
MSQGRSVTLARSGLVSSPHYLSAMAGVRIMDAGGNAIDAAIAANAVLNVVQPHGCGTGGDLFMLIYDAKSDGLYGLNASGRSPAAATLDWFKANGHTTMPQRGILPVTVPGVVDGWQMAIDRFGKLSMDKVLKPAIRYAEKGFGVGPNLHAAIENILQQSWCHDSWREVYAPNGEAPAEGSILKLPELARSLIQIGDKGRDAFYRGKIARALVEFSEKEGGLFTLEDLAAHQGEWVDPLSITYHGYTIYEMPPNTHGLSALQMLKLVEGLNLGEKFPTSEAIHLMVEAKKLAFADRAAYITDPAFMKVAPERLLDEDYIAPRRALIDPRKPMLSIAPGSLEGDTIYLCAADGKGNAVSLIQSNYMGVGSGLVVPGWGIELQNRGAYFSLDPEHANCIAPCKRTMHTLIPSMAFRNSKPEIIFGTMGGDGQPQIHLQAYTDLINFGMNIQEAIEAPRWIHGRGMPDQPEGLQVETRFPPRLLGALSRMGHPIQRVGAWNSAMGYAQGIVINQENGLLMGGADPRADSAAAGF